MYCVHDAGYLQNLWPWGQLCKGKVQHWTAPGPDTVWHTWRRVMAPGTVHVRLRARLHTSLPIWHLRCMWQYLLTPVWTSCLYLPVLRRLRISISKELAQSLSPRCSRSQHLLPCLLACTSTMTTPERAKENFCYHVGPPLFFPATPNVRSIGTVSMISVVCARTCISVVAKCWRWGHHVSVWGSRWTARWVLVATPLTVSSLSREGCARDRDSVTIALNHPSRSQVLLNVILPTYLHILGIILPLGYLFYYILNFKFKK